MLPEAAAAVVTEHALFVERRRTDAYTRDTACRAICTIKRGLRAAGAQKDGSAFVPDNWDSVFRPALGAYLKFLLSRPDQFRVVDGGRPGHYRIENVTMNKTVVALAFGKGKVKGKGKTTAAKGAGKHKGGKTAKGYGKRQSGGDASGVTTGRVGGKGKTVGKLFSRPLGKGKAAKGSGRFYGESAPAAVDEAGEDVAEADEAAEDVVDPAADGDDGMAVEEMPEGAAWDEQVEAALRLTQETVAKDAVSEGALLEDVVEDEFDLEEVVQTPSANAQDTLQQQQRGSEENVFDWSEDA